MAGFPIGPSVCFIGRNCNRLKPFLQNQTVVFNHVRNNHMFRHLGKSKEHDTVYDYEVSKDPKEWEFVEKLMPLETVPTPVEKPNYPSGWRPAKAEALNHPYFVERTKNHMLSVYLNKKVNSGLSITRLSNIHGDLWRLHDELKAYIEEEVGKKVATFVHEGNGIIKFKGDFVYYVEQWLLSKGF